MPWAWRWDSRQPRGRCKNSNAGEMMIGVKFILELASQSEEEPAEENYLGIGPHREQCK
jgi:hypothetical protein